VSLRNPYLREILKRALLAWCSRSQIDRYPTADVLDRIMKIIEEAVPDPA
jgi:hypothetical protein